MLILGPAGVGKSWSGMYFLVQAIKLGMSVVFESVPRDLVFVFSRAGSRVFAGTANEMNCPELKSPSTIHIFDAKAGGREPNATSARIVVLSSTNRSSYAQTERRNIFMACYPSTSEDEFEKYVKSFNISADRANQVTHVYGTGSLRPLRSSSDPVVTVHNAVVRLDFRHLDLYVSSAAPSNGIKDGMSNPASLFCTHIDGYETEDSSSLTNVELEKKYAFPNARWSFCSKYITSLVVEKNEENFRNMLLNFLNIVGNTAANKTLGPAAGQLFEHFGPIAIGNQGLECRLFEELDNDESPKKICIPRGLINHQQNAVKLDRILNECKDSKNMYNFGNNLAGFDSFHPPNTFLQFTCSFSLRGKHPLTYKTFAACCAHFGDDPVNVVLVVPDSQEKTWCDAPSFKINDAEVVDEINRFEKREGTKSLFKLNGTRKFDALPPFVQKKLKNFRIFRGLLDVSKRNFGSTSFTKYKTPRFNYDFFLKILR